MNERKRAQKKSRKNDDAENYNNNVKATSHVSHLALSFEAESTCELLYNSSVSATELAPLKLQKLHKQAQEGGRQRT